MPPAGDETWLPPFVYVIENVLYDVTPQWNVSANRAGCRCCLVRTKFCSEGCTGCKAKREECGYNCACSEAPDKCKNREVQGGLLKRLSLVHYGPGKGWGVRAATDISKGDFVIEYVGEVISAAENERRERACEEAWSYTFTLTAASGKGDNYYIDAHAVRNLAAFINFGCAPNLEVRLVPSLTGDKRLTRVAFFAKRFIERGEELTYLRDPSATSRSKWSEIPCKCGAKPCRGFI